MIARLRQLVESLYRDDVARNASVLMLSNVILAGFGFVFWFVASHTERRGVVGVASVLVTAVSLMSTTGLLGLDAGVLRFLKSGDDAQRQVQTTLWWTTGASAVLGIGYVVLARHLSSHLAFVSEHWAASSLLLVAYLEAMVMSTIAQNVLISRRRTLTVLMANSIFSVVKVALIPVVLTAGALGLVAATTIALVLSTTLLVMAVRRRWRISMVPRRHRGALRGLAGYSTTLFLTGVENNLVQALVPLIILNHLGVEAAGAYFISVNVATALGFVASSTFQSMVASANPLEGVNEKFRRALSHVALHLTPLVLAVLVFAPTILRAFSSGDATRATSLLRLLALAAPLSALNYLFDAVAHLQVRNRLFFSMNSLNCASVIVAALAFVSRGLSGLGWAWVTAQALTALVYAIILAPTFTNSRTPTPNPNPNPTRRNHVRT